MKVKIIRGNLWYKDKVGEVFEVTEHSKCYDGELWKVVNPVNSIETGLYKKDTELFYECDLELVEPQWMSKEAALKLCIDGAKIVDEGSAHPMSYVDFNGTDFGYHCYGESKRSSIKYLGERWKLWTPPTPPKPKFAVNDFVIASDDQAYMKITAVGDYDDGYTYECTGYADESGDVFIEEHRLTKA